MATPSGAAPLANPYPITWQIKNVPKEWHRDRLETLLKTSLHPDVSVESLAPSIDGRHGQATVTVPAEANLTVPRYVFKHESLGSESLTLRTEFEGMTTLFAPPPQEHKLDIIALSGLGGHAFGSFKERGGSHMWLRDSLPKDITDKATNKPMARVIIYGYPSTVANSTNIQQIDDITTSFIISLLPLATSRPAKPIIFIGHSLGGIIVKQALVNLAKEKNSKDHESLLCAARAAAFFAVPHSGMEIGALIAMASNESSLGLVRSLNAVNSWPLKELRDRFHQLSQTKQDLRLFCFYETEQSNTAMKNDKGEWKMNGPKVMALSVTSARHCPQSEFNDGYVCAMPRSHSDIVKFGDHDAQYEKVRIVLESMARDTTESDSEVTLTKNKKECMRALWFSGMDNRSAAIGPATQGTCTWVLRESTYKQWSSADRGLLWIKGHPGVGKSTLIKFIMEEMKRTRYLDKKRSIVVSFFFNKRATDDLEKTRLGFYRSVLHQLLGQCPEALGGLVTSFSRRKDTSGQAGTDWYWQEQDLCTELANAISTILKSHALWLFVDALDESNEGTASTLVGEFKRRLKEYASSDANFHICFTARHYPVVAADCEFELQVDQKNVDDIQKYVLEEFSNQSQQLSSSEIPETVIARAHGIFLWARVALEEAIRLHRAGREPPFIVQALERLPSELQDLFRSIIISGAEEGNSLQVMQWICFAEQALSLDELRWAIIVDDDKSKQSVADCRNDPSFNADDDSMTRRLRALSCGLAEVVDTETYDLDTETYEGTTKRIQFIHETVKEFFFNHGLRLLRGTDVDSNNDPTATTIWEQRVGHYRLARTCIRYLSIVDLASYQAKALSKAKALRKYKRESFRNDLRGSARRSQTTELSFNRVRGFGRREREEEETVFALMPMPVSLVIHRPEVHDLVRRDLPFLEYASCFWMPHVKSCEENSTDKDDILDYSLWPKEDLFTQLDDIDFDTENQVSPWTTILHLAAEYGFLRRLQVTLAQAGDVGTLLNTSDSKGQTPLQLAAQNGHHAAVRMLLDTGKVNANATNHEQSSALLLAAQGGHADVVQTLLHVGRTPGIYSGKSTIFRAAARLYRAIFGNASDTARIFDPNSRDCNGNSAISLAAENGHLRVVEALLSFGKVNSEKIRHNSALLLASQNGHTEVIKTLLSRGRIDVNAKDYNFAIALAAENGHLMAVETLLNTSEVDVNSKNLRDESALLLASANGHTEVIKTLLSRGEMDVNAKDYNGDSAIALAARNGHLMAMEALLDTGKVDVNSQNFQHESALFLASQKGNTEVVKILLNRGRADANCGSNRYSRALLLASEKGHLEVVRALIQAQGVILDNKSPGGTSALLLATRQGHLEVVQVLVGTGQVDVDDQRRYNSAFSEAIRNGNVEIIKILLNTGRIHQLRQLDAHRLKCLKLGKYLQRNGLQFQVNEIFDNQVFSIGR